MSAICTIPNGCSGIARNGLVAGGGRNSARPVARGGRAARPRASGLAFGTICTVCITRRDARDWKRVVLRGRVEVRKGEGSHRGVMLTKVVGKMNGGGGFFMMVAYIVGGLSPLVHANIDAIDHRDCL